MYTLVMTRVPMPAEAMKSRHPDGFLIMGSSVAEWQLIEQLAEKGCAESIVFLVPRLSESVEAVVSRLPNRHRLRVVSSERYDELRALRNVVVFSGDGILTTAAHVRSAYGDSRWVVSGVTHALSGYLVVRHLVLLYLQAMYAHDSLICTSTAGRAAAKNLFRAVERCLARRLGHEVDCPVQFPLIPLPAPRAEWPFVARELARDALGLPRDTVVFLYLGRISEQMKADLRPLLLAFARAEIQDALLVLAGDNRLGEAGSIAAMAGTLGLADRVRITTDLTGSVKAMLYSAADVFISLSDSLQETFGVTLLEAMSAGLPVIASDWSGYRDIVRPGTSGFLIPTYWANCVSSLGATAPVAGEQESNWAAAQTVATDVPALVAAIETLARDHELRQRMGDAGRALVQGPFSGERVVRQYEDVWRESLASSQSTARERQTVEDLMAADYFRHFAHYASSQVSPDTVFSVSARGSQVVAGGLDGGSLAHDRGGFEWPRLLELLGRVHARHAVRVADLLGDAPDERDLRDLLRLAKHGLLEIAIAAPADTMDRLVAAAPGRAV